MPTLSNSSLSAAAGDDNRKVSSAAAAAATANPLADAKAKATNRLFATPSDVAYEVDKDALKDNYTPSQLKQQEMGIDWSRHNNMTAVRDFQDSNLNSGYNDTLGVGAGMDQLRRIFAPVTNAFAAADANNNKPVDDVMADLKSKGEGVTLGTLSTIAAAPGSENGSHYLSNVDRSGICGLELDGYERCLKNNSDNAERCKGAWDNFLMCQEYKSHLSMDNI